MSNKNKRDYINKKRDNADINTENWEQAIKRFQAVANPILKRHQEKIKK